MLDSPLVLLPREPLDLPEGRRGMNYKLRIAAGAAALALAGAPASAGIYTDALSKCLVEKSGTADRTLLTQWVFSAMSTHPSVRELGHAGEAKRKELAG